MIDKTKPRLKWEAIDHEDIRGGTYSHPRPYTCACMWRVSVQNGWLVQDDNKNLIYIPDGGHKWTPKYIEVNNATV